MSTFSTTTGLGVAITKNAQVAFLKGFTTVPVGGRKIWNVTATPHKTTEHDSFVFDGFADTTGEGADYSTFDTVKGNNAILTQGKITASFEVTKEASMYDRYNIVDLLKGAEGVGRIVAKRIELDIQLQFGFGLGTSYTDRNGNTINTQSADALAIFSGVHSVTGSSTTFSNTDTIAFGQTGIEDHELLFTKFINHAGQLIERIPNCVFSTNKPQLVNLVREYNKGMNHIEDANRGINAYQGKYDHVVLFYLDTDATGAKDTTKKNYWGLVDLVNNQNLILEVSQEPVIYPPQVVQRNRNALIQADAHYAYAVLDPSCVTMANA